MTREEAAGRLLESPPAKTRWGHLLTGVTDLVESEVVSPEAEVTG